MEKPPALVELVNHVPVGDKWLQLGRQLNLDQSLLDRAAQAASSSSYMFQSWLDNNPNATRRDVLVALENIGERTIADRYESWIRAEEKGNNDEPVPVTSPVSKPLSTSSVSSSLPDAVLLKKVPVKLLSLMKLLSPIADQWYEIGVSLNLGTSFLRSLERQTGSNMMKLSCVLHKRITDIPFVTWDTIIDVVSGPIINNQMISSEIALFLEKGQSDSETEARHTGAADNVPVTIESLMKLLSPIAYKWHEIGVSLDVAFGLLQSLRMGNMADVMKLCRVLNKSMEPNRTPVTWDTIMDAVSGPIVNDPETSREIAQFLEKAPEPQD